MLPIEVVVGNVQQNLCAAVGIMSRVTEVLSAEMHVRHQRKQFDVLCETRSRNRAMVPCARRNAERSVKCATSLGDPLRWFFAEDQSKFALICFCFAGRCVVHLPDNFCSRGDLLANTSRIDQRLFTWSKTTYRTHAASSILFADKGDDVVHDCSIPRSSFRSLHPNVLIEVCRCDEILVFDCSRCLHLVDSRHLEHDVGLANDPSVLVHR